MYHLTGGGGRMNYIFPSFGYADDEFQASVGGMTMAVNYVIVFEGESRLDVSF